MTIRVSKRTLLVLAGVMVLTIGGAVFFAVADAPAHAAETMQDEACQRACLREIREVFVYCRDTGRSLAQCVPDRLPWY